MVGLGVPIVSTDDFAHGSKLVLSSSFMRHLSAVCRICAKGGKFKFTLGRSLNYKILKRVCARLVSRTTAGAVDT